ncbi:MAG: ArsA-related P-loop ATPase [Pseudomonadota bacterium]
MTEAFDRLIRENKIVTFVGTGGVGKTSLSLALAIEACRQGKRVAAITVDPSRRLESLLNMTGSDSHSVSLKLPSSDNSLDVYSVDTEQGFKQFIITNISEAFYEKLNRNRIFKQISQNLRETHNFVALNQLVEVVKKGHYDFVVLDTPPCHQVIDFFESPQRLQKFFSSQLTQKSGDWLGWIQKKSMSFVEIFLKRLVGQQFVDEMESFFSTVGGLSQTVNEVSAQFIDLLSSKDSSLVLVFAPAEDKIQEARYLHQRIKEFSYQLNHFVLNRAYLSELDESEVSWEGDDEKGRRLYNYFGEKKLRSRQLMGDLKNQLGDGELKYSLIPEINNPLRTPEDFFDFSKQVREHWSVM